ncbi:zinc ribbon domain-containing protein [bacterium]|nr:zinc ribbon domain-containing protein [bacterium]
MPQIICPRCKKITNENEIRCTHCNMRLKQICPTCGTANKFGIETCSECGTMLIKYCPNCGSANFPDANICRKCHNSFEEDTVNIDYEKKNINLLNSKKDIESNSFISEQNNIVNEAEGTNISKTVQQSASEDFQNSLNNDNLNETVRITEKIEEINEDTQQEDVILSNEYENENHTEPQINEEIVEKSITDNNLIETPNNQDIVLSEEVQDLPIEENTEVEDVKTEAQIFDEHIDKIVSSEEEYEQTEEDKENDLKIVQFDSSETLLEQLSNIIQTENNAVITGICSEEGMGKTTLIKSFIDSLGQNNILTVYAESSELLKVSPYGCIRDALLRLLTLPDIHPEPNSYYSENTKQLFVKNFETLTDEEILDFMNFLYPQKKDIYENLYINKEKTHALLGKIFASIISKNQTIFVFDNFDLTDNASFEFIQYLVKKGLINNKEKLFILYREKRSADVYFDKEIAKQNIFATLYLKNMNEENIQALMKKFLNTDYIPTAVSYAVNEKGKGNIFFTEQFLALLFDIGYMFISSNMMKFKEDEPIPYLPENIEEVIKLRFDAINQPVVKDSLITASIMGYKFDKNAFAAVTGINAEQANDIFQKLVDLMYIQQTSEFEYSFKNLAVWSVIFKEANKDTRFKVICQKIYYVLSKYALSNPILLASVAKYQDEGNEAIEIWQETADISAYLGDEYIYALSLEQQLLYTGYTEETNTFSDIQLNIMEKISKIIYKTNPAKAIKLLTPLITEAGNNENQVKIVDLCGYLIKACYITSDYNGVIESVDIIFKYAENNLSPLDKALILTKKLKALFKTGNCEEGINIANNDIIGKLEEALSKENDEKLAQSLFSAWFETSINMVRLYALQGNSKALEIADNTAEIMQMNEIHNAEYTVELKLSKAFALTIVGRFIESDKIIKEVENIPEYDNKEYIAFRNLIFTMNMVFTGNIENLKEMLFDYARYAENANDQLSKHIYKVILGWITYKEGNYSQANIIYNDELTYFAKEKIVTGALLSWLLIAQSTLMTEDVENAEHIAIKALEVAQNPKFSQYHVAVYLQKLIAEINLMKGDSAAAKMYLEKGMLIAKQFGLEYGQIELYRVYAQFLGMMMMQEGADKNLLADRADKIYQAAIVSADKLKLVKLVDVITTERNELHNYCKQNGVLIKT